jgi:hypothetical protein
LPPNCNALKRQATDIIAKPMVAFAASVAPNHAKNRSTIPMDFPNRSAPGEAEAGMFENVRNGGRASTAAVRAENRPSRDTRMPA